MAEETLTLRTCSSRTRRKVTIDDAGYEMLDADELTIVQKALMLNLSERMVRLRELGEEEAATLSRELERAARVLLPGLTDAVSALLTDDHRLAIVTAFCTAPGKPAPAGEATAPAAS